MIFIASFSQLLCVCARACTRPPTFGYLQSDYSMSTWERSCFIFSEVDSSIICSLTLLLSIIHSFQILLFQYFPFFSFHLVPFFFLDSYFHMLQHLDIFIPFLSLFSLSSLWVIERSGSWHFFPQVALTLVIARCCFMHIYLKYTAIENFTYIFDHLYLFSLVSIHVLCPFLNYINYFHFVVICEFLT